MDRIKYANYQQQDVRNDPKVSVIAVYYLSSDFGLNDICRWRILFKRSLISNQLN